MYEAIAPIGISAASDPTVTKTLFQKYFANPASFQAAA
jgi:hypothetical protein